MVMKLSTPRNRASFVVQICLKYLFYDANYWTNDIDYVITSIRSLCRYSITALFSDSFIIREKPLIYRFFFRRSSCIYIWNKPELNVITLSRLEKELQQEVNFNIFLCNGNVFACLHSEIGTWSRSPLPLLDTCIRSIV